MKTWIRNRASLFVFATLCLLAYSGCTASKTADGPPGAGPTPVRIGKVTRESVPVQITAVGNVEAFATVLVKAQVSGEVVDVHFVEGDYVRKDQPLFSIDSRPYEVALRQAEANLARSRAQREQAVAAKARDAAQARNARTEFERNEPLLAQKMVSQEEYDQAKANADALAAAVVANEAAIKAADEAIQAAQADIDEARLFLDYCNIRSPLDGRTGSLLIHKGNLVRANDTSPLVTITQVQPIYVTFAVPEKHLNDIRGFMAKGPLEAVAMLPGDGNQPPAGTLTFIDNEVDERTGTIRMKATFANEDQRLWPGQFVSVSLHMTVMDNAVVAPSEAVALGQDGYYVYVVKPDMSIQVRQVIPGDTWNNLTVIQEGLEIDESVVTDGLLRASPGAKVRIIADAEEKKE